MRSIAYRFLLAVVALLLLPTLIAAAQDCSIQTITGTYAIHESGVSFLSPQLPYPPDAPPDPAALPAHAPGLYAHGVIVGVMTVKPDSSVDIRYWSTLGSWSSMRQGVSMTGAISQLGIDQAAGTGLSCSGIIEYQPFGNVPGSREKFFVLENGRELRGILMETGAFPTFAMHSTARRMTRALDAAPRCSQNTARGTLLLSCPGPLFNPAGDIKTVGSAATIHVRVEDSGAMVGTLHNRSAAQFSSTPLHGGLVINPDCTGEAWFEAPDFVPGAVLKSMFVLTDAGKYGFALPLELFYPANNLTVPYPPVSCVVERVTQ